jgi:hypothetical protein
MARTTAQVKGDALEDAVRILEMVILGVDPNAIDSPITIERKKIITVQGVRHEIDIYITINNGRGYTSTFIFECKNWKNKVDKNEIIVFARKVGDIRATKGFFIARRFTSDAISQAERDEVELLTADDVIEMLPPFLDDFHILGNKVLPHETSAKLNVTTYDPKQVGHMPGYNAESFVKHKGEDMLLGKLVERLHQETIDEYMRHEPTATFDEEKRRYETTKTVFFSMGEVFVEGLECQSIELHVVWETNVIRPPIVSIFDIKTRGRVITVETDKSPLGGSMRISFISPVV